MKTAPKVYSGLWKLKNFRGGSSGFVSHSLVQTSPAAGLQPAFGEVVFFQDRNAFVSNLRCAFTGDLRIYAACGVTSVGISSSKQRWAASVVCAIIAVIAALTEGYVAASVFILLAGGFWIGGRPKHYLSLHTSGVSYLPLWSRKREYIGSIVVAINNAIIARG
jgi:hypothetical protein